MLTRRLLLGGLLSLAAAPMATAANFPRVIAGTRSKVLVDAVIDISHMTTVNDFRTARKRSNILGVIHKATEGGDWRDPLYAKRRALAEAEGLLWGAYHFGTHQYPGADQAKLFLATAQPGPTTLMALDFEFNDQNPANSMRLRQAEEFVETILAATGRRPVIYTNAAWADGMPMGESSRRMGSHVTQQSILAQCPLWLADYRGEPQVPHAWREKGWHFWQYAGDTEQGGPRSGRTRRVFGIDRCDRNFFHGDLATLRRFWTQEVGRAIKS